MVAFFGNESLWNRAKASALFLKTVFDSIQAAMLHGGYNPPLHVGWRKQTNTYLSPVGRQPDRSAQLQLTLYGAISHNRQ